MSVDVVGSYLELNKFLEPKGFEVVPEGNFLKIMDMKRKRAVAVVDTIVEASDWAYNLYGKRILKEEE